MRTFAGLLPLMALVLVGLACACRLQSWRLGAVYAFVGVAAAALVATELLSLVSGVNAAAVATVYVALGAGAGVALSRDSRFPPVAVPRRADALLLAVIGVQVAILGVVAVAAVPNNSDSMVYHMSRVSHWAVTGSLDHYATGSPPQLYLAPLSEIGILHLQLLTDGQRLANLIQLLAHVICILGVSQIVKQFGGERRLQLAAAVLAASAPMAVAQAVTTQSDYVAAAFLVCLVVFATEPARREQTWRLALAVSVAFALAIATKATALLFGPPLVAWFAWRRLRDLPIPVLARLAGAAALIIVLINAGHVIRNVDTFGDPFGPDRPALRMSSPSASTTVGNLVRNAGHNLAWPAVRAVNDHTTAALGDAMKVAGIDPDEPSALFAAERFDIDSARNENRASSPIQWLLFAAACVWAVVNRSFRRRWGGLLLALLAGFLLFSIVLKWQPWGARLLLPLLVLSAVPSAALLSRLSRKFLPLVLVAVMVFSLPWLLASQYRPLIGDGSVLTSSPDEEYFRDRAVMQLPYTEAARYVRGLGVDRVGFVAGIDEWEYPFWQLLSEGDRHVELVAIDVRNVSSSRETPDRPAVVICVCHRKVGAGVEVHRFRRLVQVEVSAKN